MNRVVRTGTLIAALTASPLLAPSLWEGTAWAQDVFATGGVRDFLPTGEIIGDGMTPVTVHFVALAQTGAGLAGLKPKITATEGSISAITDLGGGLYSMSFLPPKAEAQKVVTLKFRGIAADKSKVDVDSNVLVFPPMARRITALANPATVTLGQDAEATISIALEGPAQQSVKGADLVVATTAGEVQNITDMGGGRFTARFVPPKVNWPQLAVITIADRRDPGRIFGSVTIPLQGKTDYPVTARPNGSVVLRIGGRDFGPVPSDANGRAVVSIIVPPGNTGAQLTSVVAGASMNENIDLKVPESKRLKLVPLPAGLPANPGVKIPVRVAVRTTTGAPDLVAKPNFVASSGTMSPARHEGEGVYVSDFTPAANNSQLDVKIDVSLAGSSLQSDSRLVTLFPPRAESLSLKSDPPSLAQGASGFRVLAAVGGPGGQGLAQRELLLSTAGAKLKGPVQDLKGGDYRAEFTTTGGPVEVQASVRAASLGNPLHGVVIVPARTVVPNDGTSTTSLTVLTVDQYGYPVPNVPVALKIERGDGNVPTTATTNAYGLAQVTYTSGRKADLVKVAVAAGDHVAQQALFQVPDVLKPVALPFSGSEEVRSFSQKWSSAFSTLRLERQGANGQAAGPITAVETGPVATVQVKAEPPMVVAGGTVVMKITAVDAEGRGVAGQTLDLLSSAGKFGTVRDAGGGQYDVSMTVPADATGEAKVSISIGNAASFLRIPLTAATNSGPGTAWGATTLDAFNTKPDTLKPPTPVTPTVPTGPTTPAVPIVPPVATPEKPPKTPKTTITTDHKPWRVALSFVGSTYRFEQRPANDTGPLLPSVFSVGGAGGGSPAMPMGAELAFRGQVPGVKFLALDANFRFTQYSVTADGFNGAYIPDALIDGKASAVVKYPFTAGKQEFHVGARVGGRYNDFLVLRGCLQGDSCQVRYETLPVPALNGGIEIGADLGRVYGTAALEQALYGLAPVATVVDVDLGVRATESITANLGFEAMYRRLDVIGNDTQLIYGEVSDAQLMLKLGAGYQF